MRKMELIHVVSVGYFETWYTNGVIAETVLKKTFFILFILRGTKMDLVDRFEALFHFLLYKKEKRQYY